MSLDTFTFLRVYWKCPGVMRLGVDGHGLAWTGKSCSGSARHRHGMGLTCSAKHTRSDLFLRVREPGATCSSGLLPCSEPQL